WPLVRTIRARSHLRKHRSAGAMTASVSSATEAGAFASYPALLAEASISKRSPPAAITRAASQMVAQRTAGAGIKTVSLARVRVQRALRRQPPRADCRSYHSGPETPGRAASLSPAARTAGGSCQVLASHRL